MIKALILVSQLLVPATVEEADKKYGRHAEYCTAVELPGTLGKAYVNKDIVLSFKSILTELTERDLIKEIKTFNGSYNNRNVRGKNRPSTHSWCLSIDLNAGEANWSSEFISVWQRHGWKWGGEFKRADSMHFSAAPWEGAKLLKVWGCPKTTIINKTERQWEPVDDIMLHEHRCAIHYKASVCLVKLYRFENYNYHATCGKRRYHEQRD